ncbi:MAG: hypothetical protein M3033_15870, partial [Acidobacteriota bacterium]|nr:hypothetical protein [Acidobacteriota bacterium]
DKDCALKKEDSKLSANFFNLKGKVVLLTQDELEKFFHLSCENGWKNFYKKYPNSNGSMGLSRVGFDGKKNFAVVNFGNQAECLNGEGQIIFLQKDNGAWKIKKTQTTWVS